MSYKLKTKDFAPPTNSDGGAWLCAIILGMAGLVLAYKIANAAGLHLVVAQHWGIVFRIGALATFVVVVVGVLLLGVPGYFLGGLIDKRLAPRVEQTILNAADEAARHPRRGGKW